MSPKNREKFPELEVGDLVEVIEFDSVIYGSIGRVSSIQHGRTVYKTMVEVQLMGAYAVSNPWYFFRNQLRKI